VLLQINLNICQTIGGNRALALTHDGESFWVADHVAKKLTAYDGIE